MLRNAKVFENHEKRLEATKFLRIPKVIENHEKRESETEKKFWERFNNIIEDRILDEMSISKLLRFVKVFEPRKTFRYVDHIGSNKITGISRNQSSLTVGPPVKYIFFISLSNQKARPVISSTNKEKFTSKGALRFKILHSR